MNYKQGDKVRVRPDLSMAIEPSIPVGIGLADAMLDYKGKLMTISVVHPEGSYALEEVGYTWTDEMLVPPSHTTAKGEKTRVSLGKWKARI